MGNFIFFLPSPKYRCIKLGLGLWKKNSSPNCKIIKKFTHIPFSDVTPIWLADCWLFLVAGFRPFTIPGVHSVYGVVSNIATHKLPCIDPAGGTTSHSKTMLMPIWIVDASPSGYPISREQYHKFSLFGVKALLLWKHHTHV